MKVIRTFAIVVTCLAACMTSSAQEYKKMWDEAYDLWQKQNLPQSAIAQAERIYEVAAQQGNTSQMMRAALFAIYHRNQLTPDSFYVDVPHLEQWVNDTTLTVADVAVLHSVLGGIYQNAQSRGSWESEAVTPRPDELDRWTRLMYAERAYEHYLASLERLEELQGHHALREYGIVYDGKWSEYYDYSLMHLIGRRAIFGLRDLRESLLGQYRQTGWDYPLDYMAFMRQETVRPLSAYDCTPAIMQTFRRMLALLEKEGHDEAWLLMELNRLNIMPRNLIDLDKKREVLEGMMKELADNPLCAEVYWTLADDYQSKGALDDELRVLQEAIKKYPRFPVVNSLRNRVSELLVFKLHVNFSRNEFYPGEKVDFRVTSRYLDKMVLRLYRVSAPVDTVYRYRYEGEKLKSYAKLYGETSYPLRNVNTCAYQEDTLQFEAPQPGYYLMEVKSNDGKLSQPLSFFNVTRLTVACLPLPGDSTEYVVLDRESGLPVPRATLHFATREKDGLIHQTATAQTDGQGCVLRPERDGESRKYLRASLGEDAFSLYTNHWVGGHSAKPEEKTYIQLFTDRRDYRPGQTVYVKGITFDLSLKNETKAREGREYKLTLLDGRKEIGVQRVKSNEFGSFSTTFTLPETGRNGAYMIKAEAGEYSASCQIRMTAYKLPTFEVTFEKMPAVSYSLGDTLHLQGTATTYTGIPVAGGKVSYSVELLHSFRNLDFYPHTFSTRHSGETFTDGEGHFTVAIPVQYEKREHEVWGRESFRVQASVTSLSGETRKGETRQMLGGSPLDIAIQGFPLNTDWMKESGRSLTFDVTDREGENAKTMVTCRLYQCGKYGEVLADSTVVYEGRVASNEKCHFPEWDTLPSGRYELVAGTALPGSKDSVFVKRGFTLYGYEETKVPDGHTQWVQWTDATFSPGKPARLQLGTSLQQVFVMMDVFRYGERVESRRFTLSDTVQTFTFDYRPGYEPGVNVSILMSGDGQTNLYQQQIPYRPETNEVQLKWATFRDRLTPGQQEEWTLEVTHPDGSPAAAEVLAGMYDEALDYLGHQGYWALLYGTPLRTFYGPWYWRWQIGGVRWMSLEVPFTPIVRKLPKNWRYADFAKIFTDFGNVTDFDNVKQSRVMMTADYGTSSKQMAENRVGAMPVMLEEEASTDDIAPSLSSLPEGMKLRENFSETAFFMPHLRTDSAGRVKIAFTLPDNLTRWHFRALAHTRDMAYAKIEENVTARKQFMVQPHLPRFVRMGDATTVSATVTNLTDGEVDGTVRLELFNPEDNRVILTRKASFRTAAGGTEVVNFSFTVKNDEVTLPACRIVAEGAGFSDGEQRYLPVLTDKVWLTESVPLVMQGKGESERSLKGLFNNDSRTAENHRLTVEFTNNPAWLALLALPVIATPETESALAWASSWYARSVASHLMTSQPRIKEMLDSIQSAAGEEHSLWSTLQKSEELKSILLDESPWLYEATEENDQRQSLSQLFDSETTNRHYELCVNKLKELQTPSGGWSWYKDMGVNRSVTTVIVEMMQRMAILTGTPLEKEAEILFRKGRAYLADCLKEEYKQMQEAEKKNKREVMPSEWALHCLYVYAIGESAFEGELHRAADGMVKRLLGETASLTPYGLARMAVILHGLGYDTEAHNCLSSLLEHTVVTQDKGRYFDNASFRFSWRNEQIPAQVAAIEAVSLLTPDDTLVVEQMKQWLLTQKQVQAWQTPISTVDAVHALLSHGADLLAGEETALLKLDNREVLTDEPLVPGLGYLKRTYSADELKTLPKKITVSKQTEGLAWGAVYAQCLEEIKSVTATNDRLATDTAAFYTQPLSVTRQILVSRIENGAETWVPVTEKTLLHKGDRLISRLTIKADREMHFVQLKEGRAACTEPQSSLSGYIHSAGQSYYRSVKDASTLFFIDRLPKGTHVIDNPLFVERAGKYLVPPVTIQCAYAPEFGGHSAGTLLVVDDK